MNKYSIIDLCSMMNLSTLSFNFHCTYPTTTTKCPIHYVVKWQSIGKPKLGFINS